ncbi:hypothetical protein GCM10009850_075260 [Nonomuraea monospora]|uniref:Uncharacterized protein n=1 Tax=Nonomuraea monospora TaxID=568818 RepID=A0ABN3CRJ4_9ACTN
MDDLKAVATLLAKPDPSPAAIDRSRERLQARITQADTHPNVAHPNVARPDAARPDAVRPDAVRPDVVRPDHVRPDAARPDAVRPDHVRPGAARRGRARLGNFRPGAARGDDARPDRTRPGNTGPGGARRGRGWLLPALGMAVAAVAAVAVILASALTPGAAPASGRDVLLMAAASAERIPAGTGEYWHITRTWQSPDGPQKQESWTSRDGHRWTRNEPNATPGAVVEDPAPFRLMGAEIGFTDLEALPSEPEELKQRLAELPRHDHAMMPADREGALVSPLITLITELPAPSRVRSAAFEALAGTPGVENAGPVEGGQELRIPLSGKVQVKMVVDPDAARVVRANILLTSEGGSAMSNSYIQVTTGWTDELPR